MKNIVIIISICLSNIVSGQESNFMNLQVLTKKSNINLIKNNYLKNDSLFTGIDTLIIPCEDSLYDRKCYSLLYYKHGELIKQMGYYDNNNKMFEKFYKNSSLDSIYTSWYSNKQKRQTINYFERNKVFPSQIEWYRNGQKKLQITYNDSLGLLEEWYENGKLKSLSDIDLIYGSIVSFSKEWCPNGFVIQDLKINQGKQKYERYNCDSIKIAEGTYIDFEFFWVGKKTEWYGNGIKAMDSYFFDGNNRQEANIRIGTWKYYSEQGKLIREEIYENNKLIDSKEYLPLKMKKD